MFLTFPCYSWRWNPNIFKEDRTSPHSQELHSCGHTTQHNPIRWKTNFSLSKMANTWPDKSKTWRFLKGLMPLSWSVQRTSSSQLSLKQGAIRSWTCTIFPIFFNLFVIFSGSLVVWMSSACAYLQIQTYLHCMSWIHILVYVCLVST